MFLGLISVFYPKRCYTHSMKLRIFLFVAMLMLSGCKGNGHFGLRSSLLGQFADTSASSSEQGGHYTIAVNVHSTGIYNLVRGKRIEKYRSSGTVRHGRYYSHHFSIEKWANGKHTLAEYTPNYRTKTIVRRFRQWEKGNKLSEDVKDRMDYFGHDDFLTVLHNAVYQQPKTSGRRTTVVVAGADNSHGKVPVYVSHDPKRVRQWGGVPGGVLIQMGIAKRIFEGGKGSITVVLDPKNHPTRIIIKKVKIVGTVTGKPIK